MRFHFRQHRRASTVEIRLDSGERPGERSCRRLLRQYDVNDLAASVLVYALKGEEAGSSSLLTSIFSFFGHDGLGGVKA